MNQPIPVTKDLHDTAVPAIRNVKSFEDIEALPVYQWCEDHPVALVFIFAGAVFLIAGVVALLGI
jgi:hypothetical protein